MSASILEEINQDVGLNDTFFERVHEQFCTRDGYAALLDIKRKFEEIGRYDLFEYGYLDFLGRHSPDDWKRVYSLLQSLPTENNITRVEDDKRRFLMGFHKINKNGNAYDILDDAIANYIIKSEHIIIIAGKPYIYENGVYKKDEE